MRRTSAVLTLSVLALAALPAASASAAATVSSTGGVLTVVSSVAGEANTILLSRDPATSSIVVTESDPSVGAITAGGGCLAGPASPEGPTVRCPAAGIAKVDVHLGPSEDAFADLGVDLPATVRGEDGHDTLEGGEAADVLDGGAGEDDLVGYGGDDRLAGGPEPDLFDGGDGRDILDAVDGGRDRSLDCGTGDDDVDTDPQDAWPVGCEAVAPEFLTPPQIAGPNGWHVGTNVAVPFGYAMPGDHRPELQIQWEACTPGGGCVTEAPVADVNRWTVATDLGRTLAATVTLSNRAGSVSVKTAQSPVIGPNPHARPPLPAPPAPPVPPKAPAPTRASLAKALSGALTAWARQLGKADPRTIARRGAAPFSLALPSLERATVRWTVPAATARRHGLRVRGKGPVVLATAGAGARQPGPTATLTVKLTGQGRALLRRAKRLRVDTTTKATLTGAQATPLTAKGTFTLRRR